MAADDARARALHEIARIANQYQLSGADIAAVLGSPSPGAPQARARSVMVRVLGFLGGTFVFAGIGVFIALQWSDMNSAARVVITLGSGAVAFVLAVLSTREQRFDKVTVPLFLIAAALEPTGMVVAFSEYGSGGEWRLAALVTAGTMALQFGATFAALRQSTPLFMTILFGALFWWTALDLLDVDGNIVALALGGSMLLAAVGVDRTPHRDITAVWYLLGTAAFLQGFFDLVEGSLFEVAFIVVAAAFVYLSIVLHRRTVLVVAIVAILAYTAWFTGEYFADSVGWPLALIAFGIFMIALSALAVRIDRDYVRNSPL
jgi:hypothetical protein